MAYDLFFLSFQEPDADQKWATFKERFSHAKRVDGVTGILAAHQECARRSLTSHFFVVDADNELLPNFNPAFKVGEHDRQYVHLWYARNPVNRLEYGWGGLKLFPKREVLAASSMGFDMTTGFELKIIQETVSITHFNSTPFEAWRSGFREGAKLTHGKFKNQNSVENDHRLQVWTTVGAEVLNGKCAIKGAKDGRDFATLSPDISPINDWNWLRVRYEETYANGN
jgi:hypothetical protein